MSYFLTKYQLQYLQLLNEKAEIIIFVVLLITVLRIKKGNIFLTTLIDIKITLKQDNLYLNYLQLRF